MEDKGRLRTGTELELTVNRRTENTMKLLEQIQSGTQTKPRRVLLYGAHGVGKSTWGSMAESPIFISTEDGLDDIDCRSFPLARGYDDVLAALGELYSEEHDYRTVVVDSLDWMERLIWAEVCRNRGVESIEDIGYAKGYVFALTQWREILEGLDALRNERGMTVILIAHARIEKFDNPETDSYDRYSPALHRLASALVQEWCTEVLFATYRVHTKTTDKGFDRKRVHGIGSGERILHTTERPAHVAKNRLSLPDELPLDYRVFAALVRGENPLATDDRQEPEEQGD